LMFSVLPVAAGAQSDMNGNPLPVLEQPKSLGVRMAEDNTTLILRYTQPDSIMDIIENTEEGWEPPLIELDVKLNEGSWTFDRTPGVFREQALAEYYETSYAGIIGGTWPGVTGDTFILLPGNTIHDETNAFDAWLYPDWMGLDGWNMENNTYSFRFRYVYEYESYDEASDTWGYMDVVSSWSDTAVIGKNAAGSILQSLEAPSSLAGERKAREKGRPYFYFTYAIPQSVEAANRQVAVVNVLDWKISGGTWASEAGADMFEQPGNVLSSVMEFDPIDTGGWGEINIEQNTYSFRMCFEFVKADGTIYRSPFSNVVTIGVQAWSNASAWATAQLEQAGALGLIPDSLRGGDMTKPITRAEFAAVSVKVYEALSGTAAIPAVTNPFTDTTDVEVLKAYNIGTTSGVGNGKFAPDALLNREQAATMLTCVFKKVSMPGWTLSTNSQFSLDYSKPALFADDEKISDWAKDSVYFMAANGIISGTGNNKFSPRATTPAEEAANYASATREQALIIAVRMVENLK
ncbi:MAG: S-layer homology domain-containing protein, partial [Lawsonibacter sp.]